MNIFISFSFFFFQANVQSYLTSIKQNFQELQRQWDEVKSLAATALPHIQVLSAFIYKILIYSVLYFELIL